METFTDNLNDYSFSLLFYPNSNKLCCAVWPPSIQHDLSELNLKWELSETKIG